MKIKVFIGVIVIAGFFLLLPQPVDKLQQEPRQVSKFLSKLNNNFILRNVRFYDGDVLYENTDVLVQNNLIAKIEKNQNVSENLVEFDGTNKTILPGFIDAHTHVYGNALKDALNFGVTTELDMFTVPETANQYQSVRENDDNIENADLFSSTILATTRGGHGTEYGLKIPVLETTTEVDDFVRKRIQQGADYIKAVYNSKQADKQFYPSISYEILSTLITVAHHQDRMLLVHVDNLISAREAIMLGADGLVHSFMDSVVDESFIKLMLKKNAFIIPTLSVEASVAQQAVGNNLLDDENIMPFLSNQQKHELKAAFPDFDIPSDGLQNAFKSVKKLSLAGVKILAGTDAPNPGTTHGASLHGELRLLVKAGLNNQEAIHSATGAVRKAFEIGNRGTLKIGAKASMILLDGNPFVDINDTSKISAIWKNGQLVERFKYLDKEPTTIKISPSLISDFNDSIQSTQFGKGIVATTDQFAGGDSIVQLTGLTRNKGDGYLQVHGEVKAGLMFPWSGITFLLSESMQQGVDISNLESISFDAKSNTESQIVSVLIFQQYSFQPLEQTLLLTKDWQNYVIDIKKYGSIDLSNIVNISIVASEKRGDFEFSLDNLSLN